MRLIPIAGFCGAGKSLATLRLALQMQQNGESVCICLDRENPITRALVEEYKIKAFTGKPRRSRDMRMSSVSATGWIPATRQS